MSEIKTVHDKDHPVPEPVVQLHDEPVVIWGPMTTINHLADAMDRAKAWKAARDPGAPADELAALAKHALSPITHPTLLELPVKRQRAAASPSAPETQEANANGDAFAAPDPDAPLLTYGAHVDKEPKGVPVKLPKTKLKLKI